MNSVVNESDSAWKRRATLLLLLLSFAVRLLLALRISVILPDSAIYLNQADSFLSGDWVSALNTVYHPGYSSVLAMLRIFTRSTIWAQALSALLGALACPVVALAAFELASHATAKPDVTNTTVCGNFCVNRLVFWCAGIWTAWHFSLVVPAAQIIAYSYCYLCISCGVYFAIKSTHVSRLQFRYAIHSGVFFGLGFLGRPDVILQAFGAGVGLLVIAAWRAYFRPSPTQSRQRTLLLPIAFGICFFLVAGPYIGWVSVQSGRFRLSFKKDPEAWIKGHFRASKGTAFARIRHKIIHHDSDDLLQFKTETREKVLRKSINDALNKTMKSVNPILWLLFFATLLANWRRKTLSAAVAVVAGAILCLFAGHVFLHFHAGYLSTTHASYQVIYVAIIASQIAGEIKKLDSTRLTERMLSAIWLLLCVVPILPNLHHSVWRVPYSRKQGFRIVGEALNTLTATRESSHSAPEKLARRIVVIGEETRNLAYYAGAQFVDLQDADRQADVLREIANQGRLYLAVYVRTRQANLNPRLVESLSEIRVKPGLKFISKRVLSYESQSGKKNYHWRVYKLNAER